MAQQNADNLKLLAEKIGTETVKNFVEELLLDNDVEGTQYYLLGALEKYLERTDPSEVQLKEYYQLLGLPSEDSREMIARSRN